MRKTKLNLALLHKIERSTRKTPQYIRETISRRAGRLGVDALTAQLLLARELKIGVAHALSKADPNVKQEYSGAIRSVSTPSEAFPPRRHSTRKTAAQRIKKSQKLGSAEIKLLLRDAQLLGRCKDLLLAGDHFDRAVREATTVLEDRVKKLSTLSHLTSVPLIATALNPEPTKAILVVSDERDEQDGVFSICKGVMLTFRNKTHHNLINNLTQADALKFCGLIDTILAVLATAQQHLNRI